MLTRAVAVAAMASLLVACSAVKAQEQAVTRIETTPTPFCPSAPHVAARPTDTIYTYFAPDPIPGVFALHLSQSVTEDTIRVQLQDASYRTILPSPFRALGPSGFPAALEAYCQRDDGGVTYRFAIGERGLAPGFYSIEADAPGNFNVRRRSIRIYVAPQPRAAPALRVGQRYLVVPVTNVVYADENGMAIPWSAISLHVARITSIGSATVMLDVAQTTYRIREERSSDSPALLGLAPLADDASQEEMDSWYAGKEVWNRGQLLSLCGTGSTALIDSKSGGGYDVGTVRVRHVYRVDVPFYILALGDMIGANGFGHASGFDVSSPLLVTLDVRDPRPGFSACPQSYSLFADAWDMQRALSTVSVRTAHPDWPPAMLEDIEDHNIAVGMTHEMVAWSIGFPAFEGSPNELYRLSDWDYDSNPRATYSVHFGADGRVKSFGTQN
jgi:hypothetical protein